MSTATERISWFPVPDESELPEDLQGLFRAARERIGFVPNVFRAYSFRPDRLSAWFAHFRLVMEGTPGLREDEWDAIEVAAMYNFTTRLAQAGGQIPNAEYHALSR